MKDLPTTTHIGIDDARRTLGPLVEQVNDGGDVVLTRHGRPVARIVPIAAPRATIAEWISTFRSFATAPTVVDGLGLDDRVPGLMDLGRAQVTYQAAPFAALIAAIDAFFGDELDDALTGPEAAEAETEARRIITEHLATVATRLAITAAALSQVNLVTASWDTLQSLASTMLKRAADQRFAEIVTRAVAT